MCDAAQTLLVEKLTNGLDFSFCMAFAISHCHRLYFRRLTMFTTMQATRSHRFILSTSAAAMIVLLIAIAPPSASAAQAVKTDAKPMLTSPPMDHSKMQPMKEMDDMKPMDEVKPMDEMKDMHGMKPMEAMSMTGDVDYDFAVNMRAHHQMALDMSEVELKNGKSPKLRAMATNIIAAQKKEIASLDKWINETKKPLMKAVMPTK
jgi:hypothetical protein